MKIVTELKQLSKECREANETNCDGDLVADRLDGIVKKIESETSNTEFRKVVCDGCGSDSELSQGYKDGELKIYCNECLGEN